MDSVTQRRKIPSISKLGQIVIFAGLVCGGPAVATEPQTIDKLGEISESLGAVAGLAIICAGSPATDTDAALKWYEFSIELEDLATAYARKIAPGDDAAQEAAYVGFQIASFYQQKDPDLPRSDPLGCGGDLVEEVSEFINGVRNGFDSLSWMGWTTGNLSRRLSVHANTVSAWKSGARDIPPYVSEYLRVVGLAREILDQP